MELQGRSKFYFSYKVSDDAKSLMLRKGTVLYGLKKRRGLRSIDSSYLNVSIPEKKVTTETKLDSYFSDRYMDIRTKELIYINKDHVLISINKKGQLQLGRLPEKCHHTRHYSGLVNSTNGFFVTRLADNSLLIASETCIVNWSQDIGYQMILEPKDQKIIAAQISPDKKHLALVLSAPQSPRELQLTKILPNKKIDVVNKIKINGPINDIVINHDNSHIIFGDKKQWDVINETVTPFEGDSKHFEVTYSKDGTYVAINYFKKIKIVNLTNNETKEIATNNQSSTFKDIKFSNDSKSLFYVSNETLSRITVPEDGNQQKTQKLMRSVLNQFLISE